MNCQIMDNVADKVTGGEGVQNTSTLPADVTEIQHGERDGRLFAMFRRLPSSCRCWRPWFRYTRRTMRTTGDPVRFLAFWLALTIGAVNGQKYLDSRSYRSKFLKPAPPRSLAHLRAFGRAVAAVWRECQAEI